MFGWFKKKVVEEVPKEQPKELTLEERINIFKKNNHVRIALCEQMKIDQKMFVVGELVKYNISNSPIMTVVRFNPYNYDIYTHWFWLNVPDLYIQEDFPEIELEYFDSNNVLQKITTTPDKVIKL